MTKTDAIIGASPRQVAREISVVTAEIRERSRQSKNMALMYAIEIGRRLFEAKSVLAHGEWGNWLKNEVSFSQSTANNFMRLFEEYGAEQISVFGAVANSQTIENLPYSKALQLLALPSEEREEFAATVDAENITVRELAAAVKERTEAVARAKEAEMREKELEAAVSIAEEARKNAEKKAADAEHYSVLAENLQKQLDSSVEREKKIKEKLKEAQANPEIPKEKIEEIKAEAEEAAKSSAENKYRADAEEAKRRAERAEAERALCELKAKAAEDKLTELQSKMKTANPELAAFKTLFEQVQEITMKLKGMIIAVGEHDPATADKLKAALHAFGGTL